MDSLLAPRTATASHPAQVPAEVALQLPFDFARTPGGTALGASHGFSLTLPDSGAVAADALLCAAFAAVLACYSGQDTIPLRHARLLGTGRVLSCTALRLRTSADVTLQALLVQVAEQSQDVVAAHGDASGGRAAIGFIDADLGDAPEVQRLLTQSSAELRSADLHFVVTGTGARRHCALVYDAKLFKPSTVARCAAHLGVLLAAVAARLAPRTAATPGTPLDLPLAQWPLLTAAEREWLAGVGHGRSRSLAGPFVHQAFEARCLAAPQATAVRFRDAQLSYAQLNARANRLAHHLLAQGIGVDDAVVVCVEPELDIAVALLAVLKAGAVYVPLDPTYPAPRIRAILEDTRPRFVLTRSHLLERLALAGTPYFAFDVHAALLDDLPDANPARPVDASHTASIYYTSGTTGKPKGVMASHANLRAYIDLARERYAIGAHDVMPAIARFSFSISMFELMSPLAAGATLIVLERDHVLDLERLARTLQDVTFFHAGPSLLKNLLAHIKRHHTDFSEFAGVRHASSGGDMIAPEVLESLKQVFPCAEVFVIYGCSEVSCMGCTYPVPRDTTLTRTLVGRPFDNVEVRVLGAQLNPLPAGVVGEICFAGAGVVKGYLRRPELTAEKFVDVDGQRFYRTGDMGRFTDDGWLEILGRNDFQINVRGMRIELGEVEAHLRKAPGVRDGVTMAKPAPSGEKLLVAYFVPDFERAAARPAERVAAIRRHLVDHLPDYMVPASYVELEALPLNHNMKVDRRALPEPVPAQQRAAGATALREPETDTERALARLWQRLLDVGDVGLDDNFFELGGQSLSAMQFSAAVQRELGTELAGMEVLRESLEVLAALCDRRLGRAAPDVAQRARSGSAAERIEIFHFGPQRSLYGALHWPTNPARSDQAVLVCAPVGHEHVRSHFILNRLGRQLAAQGLPVLRFDYHGCGDSLGDSIDAGCERWQNDIVDAFTELQRRSGATRIAGVGARLGATLLSHALPRIALTRLVLWDPVGQGMDFYAEMAEMQRRYVLGTQHLRLGRAPRANLAAVELLGATYSPAAVRQFQTLALAPPPRDLPVGWLIASQPQQQRALIEKYAGGARTCHVEQLDFDCGWTAIARMSEVLPDVGISRALGQLLKDDA
jgi:amino acid adenylation domain-containing protein